MVCWGDGLSDPRSHWNFTFSGVKVTGRQFHSGRCSQALKPSKKLLSPSSKHFGFLRMELKILGRNRPRGLIAKHDFISPRAHPHQTSKCHCGIWCFFKSVSSVYKHSKWQANSQKRVPARSRHFFIWKRFSPMKPFTQDVKADLQACKSFNVACLLCEHSH